MSADDELVDDQEGKIKTDPAEILDPGDYNQNQRLKEIHTARQEVRKVLGDMKSQGTRREHDIQHTRLAEAVAFYGHELLPMMDEADWTHEFTETGHPPEDVRDFIYHMGRFPETEAPYTPKHLTMSVFARLNEFAREIGLGADFDDGTDEWEV
jgi:hypothetical protein